MVDVLMSAPQLDMTVTNNNMFNYLQYAAFKGNK